MFKEMGKRASIRKLFHQTSGDATGSLLSQETFFCQKFNQSVDSEHIGEG